MWKVDALRLFNKKNILLYILFMKGGFSMSDNWVVQNLQNALDTWNSKLAEIWSLLTKSPSQFRGGTIWNIILDINGAMQAIGLALLVLFF